MLRMSQIRWSGPVLAAVLLASVRGLYAQSCTTQARMSAADRGALADASLALAKAVQAGDAARVQSLTVAEFAANQQSFAPTADLVHATALQVAQDAVQVTQVYLLDARGRTAGETDTAEFSCPLADSASETDFAIPALPPGLYGFAMVEATGAKPWLLAFLLRQDVSPGGAAAGIWKMAGFYPRARTAAGHDGGWYWKAAYDDGNAGQHWLAWVLFGEADRLLRPANFVTSTKLDSLTAEQRAAAPPELAHGIGPDTPLRFKAADGTEFSLIGLDAAVSDDGARLDLVLHRKLDEADDATAKAHNEAVAKAFVAAHPELRSGFGAVLVFAEASGQAPVVSSLKMAAIP